MFDSHRPWSPAVGRMIPGIGLALSLAACGQVPAPSPPTSAPASPVLASATVAPLATAADGRPQEAILIESLGPGSRLTSPIQLQGQADPAFEGALAVRLLALDGSQLASLSATIQAGIGQRGPFKAEIPFSVSQPQQAFLQVFATSPRDGGVTHLASVGVQLVPGGTQDVRPVARHPEQIAIRQPQAGATVSGGHLHVSGFGVAGFEQTLVVGLYDGQGNRLAEQPVVVQAPDLGQPGSFQAELSYSISLPGPGRLAVRDISPAFGGDVHVSSIEVQLQP
jgi:hypothetical protein